MAQQNINFGSGPDDPNADSIRASFAKCQNNFTELYRSSATTGVTELLVGVGLVQDSTVGKVNVYANIHQVKVSSTSLNVGINGSTGSNTATLTRGSDTLVIDIGDSITTGIIYNAMFGANASNQPNITSLGTLTGLTSSGVVSVTNTTPATSTTTGSLKTSGGLGVAGNIYAGAFYGAATGLTSIPGANVSGAVPSATVAATVTTAAQPNITSVGSNLTVSSGTGRINIQSIDNSIAIGRIDGVASSPYINFYSGASLSGYDARIICSGGNGVTGSGNLSLSASSVLIPTVTPATSKTTGGLVVSGGLGVAGNIYANTISAVESLGVGISSTANTVVKLQIDSPSTQTANIARFSKNSIDQVWITSSGNLQTINSVIASGNIQSDLLVSSPQLKSTIATGTPPLIVTSTTQVANLNANLLNGYYASQILAPDTVVVRYANNAIAVETLNANNISVSAQSNITSLGTLTGLTSSGVVSVTNTTPATSTTTGSLKTSGGLGVAGNIYAGAFYGPGTGLTSIPGANVSGAVPSATVAATVTTAAQPNITSLGTLTELTLSGQVTSLLPDGTAPFAVSSSTVVANLNANLLNGYSTSITASPSTVVIRDANGDITANNFIGTMSSSSISVIDNSTNNAVTITQQGSGNAFVVTDEPSDTTVFLISNSGNVGIGVNSTVATNAKLEVLGNVKVNNHLTVSTSHSVSGAGLKSLVSYSSSLYRSSKHHIQISQASKYQASEVLVIHDGSSTFLTEYGVVYSSNDLGSISSSLSGGLVTLQITLTDTSNTAAITVLSDITLI